jgi:hypothetical protein
MASCCLSLGRVLRHQAAAAAEAMLLGADSVASAAAAQTSTAAASVAHIHSLLSSAFVLASTDGGHQRDVMRGALLELAGLYLFLSRPGSTAAVHVGQGDISSAARDALAGAAAACLRGAHAVSE